jgi:hypothetical protein
MIKRGIVNFVVVTQRVSGAIQCAVLYRSPPTSSTKTFIFCDADVVIKRVGENEFRLRAGACKNEVFAMSGDTAFFNDAIKRIAGDMIDGEQFEAVAEQIGIDDFDKAVLVIASAHFGMNGLFEDRTKAAFGESNGAGEIEKILIGPAVVTHHVLEDASFKGRVAKTSIIWHLREREYTIEKFLDV